MSQQYARLVAGQFTAIRYTEAALRFGATITNVTDTGDQIVPVIDALVNTGTDADPVFRLPTAKELSHAVTSIESLAQPLYERDLGQPNGIASLDESGDVHHDQVPDEVVEYLGTWDPVTNTPELADGIGNIGDSYRVAEEVGNEDLEIDLGHGVISVRGGMSIVFRAELGDEQLGEWYVSGSSGLSNDDRFLLENSLQKVKVYELECVPAALNLTVEATALAQLQSANNPYPEYTLVSDGGLPQVTLNAYSGELRVDTTGAEAGLHTVKVLVGGNLGQTDALEIPVTVTDMPV